MKRLVPLDPKVVTRAQRHLLKFLSEEGQHMSFDARCHPDCARIHKLGGTSRLKDVRGKVVGPLDLVIHLEPGRAGSYLFEGGGAEMNKSCLHLILNSRAHDIFALLSRPRELIQLRRFFVHELTHTVDTNGPPLAQYIHPSDDLRGYVNQVFELRAYASELADLFHQKGLTAETFLPELAANGIWKKMDPHLTPKNRNRLLKTIYQALESEAPKQKRWISRRRQA